MAKMHFWLLKNGIIFPLNRTYLAFKMFMLTNGYVIQVRKQKFIHWNTFSASQQNKYINCFKGS